MERDELLKRISIDPNICFGKPCIRGTRLWVSLILDNLADGIDERELLENCLKLTHEDVFAAIAYGAEMSRERYVSRCEIQSRRKYRVQCCPGCTRGRSRLPGSCRRVCFRKILRGACGSSRSD
ncbi:MAG: DUF433 domain-containing protein [Gammaproteobacteria bacterium]